MKVFENENAVSPVVGVMLMLVVTIIIAAVVSGFAGGFAGSTQSTPTAALDVKIYSSANVGGTMSNTYAPDFTIDHLSGDTLNTADLAIKFSWANNTGHKFYTTFDGTNTTAKGQSYKDNFNYGYGVPLFVNGKSEAWGSGTISSGSHVQTGGNYLKQDYLLAGFGGTGTTIVHNGSVFMDDLLGRGLNDSDYTKLDDDAGSAGATLTKGIMSILPVGTNVKVTIVYKPTGASIFDKEVTVQ